MMMGGYGNGMMGGYANGMGPGAWILIGLFWLLLLGAILWAVLKLMPRSPERGRSAEASPEEILDRRFAAGELDVEAYRTQRDALTSARGTGR